jgi:hypothetical protein
VNTRAQNRFSFLNFWMVMIFLGNVGFHFS